MKAISIKQPWAALIAAGKKTIEVRSWKTDYRGPLLIVSSQRPARHGLTRGIVQWYRDQDPHSPLVRMGHAIAVVDLIDCRRLNVMGDAEAACCFGRPGYMAWVVANPRLLANPFPVSGRQRLYEVDYDEGGQG